MSVGVTKILRCGSCFFAKLNPQLMAQDLSKRVCFGAPPSAIQLPVQGGGLTLQMARPIVGVSEDACALYRAKDTEDVARDDDNIKTIQSMSETRQ